MDHKGLSQIPQDCLVIQLKENTKVPDADSGAIAGHKSGVPLREFISIRENVGLVLDSKFIVFDIDDPSLGGSFMSKMEQLNTWNQNTKRGKHYLFRVPSEWGLKPKNFELKNSSGQKFGDIKTSGYIVAPGSIVDGFTYTCVNDCDPLPAPRWLLEQVEQLSRDRKRSSEAVPERSGIPHGEHDDFLVRLAGYLRGAARLSPETIQDVLFSGALTALEGVDEADPYLESDLERIARSAAKWTPETPSVDLIPENWVCGRQVPLVPPPLRWWVRDFVPRGKLLGIYGPGGIGKSSWVSWLAAQVTLKQGNVGYLGVEEPFDLFLARSVLSGGDRDRIFAFPDADQVLLPANAAALAQAIGKLDLGLLYFDSIYSHFEAMEGLNAAERARRVMGALSKVAQATGCTILYTFHENKSGAYLGSTEMISVARHMLKASRSAGGPFVIAVTKTNIRQPDCMLAFQGDEIDLHDPETGETALEEDESGKLVPLKLRVHHRIEDIPANSIAMEDLVSED